MVREGQALNQSQSAAESKSSHNEGNLARLWVSQIKVTGRRPKSPCGNRVLRSNQFSGRYGVEQLDFLIQTGDRPPNQETLQAKAGRVIFLRMRRFSVVGASLSHQ